MRMEIARADGPFTPPSCCVRPAARSAAISGPGASQTAQHGTPNAFASSTHVLRCSSLKLHRSMTQHRCAASDFRAAASQFLRVPNASWFARSHWVVLLSFKLAANVLLPLPYTYHSVILFFTKKHSQDHSTVEPISTNKAKQ